MPKRSLKLEKALLTRVEDSRYSRLRFESFSSNAGGFEDADHHDWSAEEVHAIEQLILRGYLAKEIVSDAPWLESPETGVYRESYIFMTPEGYDWLDNRDPILRFYRNVIQNIPAIIVAVVIAALLQFLGFSD